MLARVISVAFLLSALLGPAFTAKAAPTDARVLHLLHKLKRALPGSLAYRPVEFLVTKLTKLDPRNAVRYYRIGISRLPASPPPDMEMTKLALGILKIVQRADLTSTELRKIERYLTADRGYHPPPNPNSTP